VAYRLWHGPNVSEADILAPNVTRAGCRSFSHAHGIARRGADDGDRSRQTRAFLLNKSMISSLREASAIR
jgi:hypothetical protein